LNHSQNKKQIPPWERRLKKQIDDFRKDIGRAQQARRGNASNRIIKHIRRIKNTVQVQVQVLVHVQVQVQVHVQVQAKHDLSNVHTTEILDTLKKKLSTTSQRLRRYKEANERKQQNRFFTTNEKTYCYRKLKSERQQPDCQDKLPNKQVLTNYWTSIWGNAVKHNLKASWTKSEQTRMSNVRAMEHSPITTEQVSRLIAKTLNWKAAGPDGINDFWIKRFVSLQLLIPI
jgi:hypothetical protein